MYQLVKYFSMPGCKYGEVREEIARKVFSVNRALEIEFYRFTNKGYNPGSFQNQGNVIHPKNSSTDK
ncbi:MAG: hypothetical protein ABI472_03815 [Ginsengibacter sp.]